MRSRSIDPRELRRALGAFVTGVTIVTTIDPDGQPRGLTANSFTSVSLDPPLVLVCIAKSARSCPAFIAASSFAVNILAEHQRSLSVAFATGSRDRFAAVRWAQKTTGAPVLEGVASWLDCRMHETIDAGDHVILMGRVVDFDHGTASPLGYCRGAYVSFGLAEEAIDAPGGRAALRFGAIVEHRGSVLLERGSESSSVGLPTAEHLGSIGNPNSLKGQLFARGIAVDLTFLFAVVEDPSRVTHIIFYRGEARDVAPAAEKSFVPFGAIPWAEIRNDAISSMLQRYVHEREQDTFLL